MAVPKAAPVAVAAMMGEAKLAEVEGPQVGDAMEVETVVEAEVARKVMVGAAVPMADEVAADAEVDTVAGCCNATPPQQHGTRRRLAR